MITLIKRLKAAGVSLKVGDDEQLKIKAPKGVLTEELREEIKEYKEYIINYLKIRACPRDIDIPLSYAQERLWFLDQLEPDSAGYNIPGAIRISGELNVAILEKSFTYIIERHETLRTAFQAKDGKPLQIIKEPEYFHIPITDLTNEADKESKAKEIAFKEANTPFKLATGPLLRAKLIKLEEKESVLVVNMHHIISDGWSMGVLISELGLIMNFLIKGETPALEPLPVQYADFGVWQRNWLEAGELERQLSYWKEELSDAPALLNLPTDFPRPAIQTYNGSTINFTIPEKLTSKLNWISKKEDITLFMTLLASFNVLLHKLTGEEDFCVGSPIANRNRDEIEGLIGFFVNTLVLRSKIEDGQSFSGLLKVIKDTTLDAYDHQDTPFEKLVEVLTLDRNMSYSPLFQVMMVLQNTPNENIDLGDVKIAPFEIDSETAKFDLTLNLEESGNILNGDFEYNTDLFKPDTISRIIKYYLRILETISANREVKIEDIELIDEEEKHKLLVEWNDTKVDYPRDKCIHQLFEEQVTKTPDNIAVVFEDKQLTYAELNKKSNQLANYLRKHGVKTQEIVALMPNRSFEMIIAILAVMKAGGAYVPIDPEYPASRIEFMLKDTGAKLLLTQKYIGENIQYDIEKINLDDEKIYEGKSDNPENINESHDLLYVMYTSGSTGAPKGVLVEHINAVRLIKNTTFININETDRILQTGNIVFDATTFEFWGALLNGAGLCLIKDKEILEAKTLGEMIKKYNVTILWLTSPLFTQISEEDDRIFSGIKYLLVGGDILSPPHINKVRTRHKGIRILNGYGPTENTTFSTIHEIDREYENKIPLGRPISNSTAYILDKKGNPQPIGVLGELCVGGDGVARGYLNRPELTAEKFIPDPFIGITGARLYKTGDLARWMDDGTIEFFGRIDTQVKIRGFRIECGEIEAVLIQNENIKDAVVMAHKEKDAENKLVAYIVFKNSDNSLTTTDLRKILTNKLPDYMVPSYFVQLDKIPLTPNGKIDRKALPEHDKSLRGNNEYVAPGNETEDKLVNIWQEILKVERIGIYDNFFELGGHSLLATQVISRIREKFNAEIPVRALFEYPTIEEFAKTLSQFSKEIAPEILPVSRESNLPLSYAQERLWFLDQLAPDSAGYNMPGAIRISGGLNVEILEQSFTRIIERHENLRTVFQTQDGKPVQIIKEPEYFHIPVTDLGNSEDKESEAREIAIAEANNPFNLSTGPLLRAKLIKLETKEHILVFNMHHIISDGWSMGVFIRELGQIMDSLIKGETPELEPLPVQYADFGVWQRNWLGGGELEKQLSYWKEQLSDAPAVLNLPLDYSRPAIQTYNGSSFNFTISEKLTARLNEISKKERVTLFMIMLASFNALLYKLTGDEDFCIGSPIANRNRKETEGLIGFFVNTLVLRTKIESKQSFGDLLKAVKQTTLDAYEHQDTPFEKLVEALAPDRNMSYSPLFQVMMSLENTPGESINLGDLQISPFAIDSDVTKFDLSLNLSETGNILEGSLTYNTSLFRQDTISGIIKYYLKILETIVANNEVNLSDIDLLDEEEKHKLLIEWNDTKIDYPVSKCIQQLFEEQVERTPDNIALVFQNNRMTYSELNEKANQVANHLRNHGVGREDIVAIIADKSLEMIIGFLGILKSGGAYLPIAPTLPQDRINFMLQDTQSKFLLAQQHLMDEVGKLLQSSTPFGKGGMGDLTQQQILLNPEIINLNDEAIYSLNTSNPERINELSDLAYIIYTSGSTGKPKGVMVEHSQLATHIPVLNNRMTLEHTINMAFTASFIFDVSIKQILIPLTIGGKLFIPDKEQVVEPDKFWKALAEEEINVINTVPTYMETLLRDEAACNIYKGIKDKYFIMGGEVFSKSLLKKLKTCFPDAKLYNRYGPTETTITASEYQLPDEIADRTIPIGKPLPGYEFYVLDRHGNLLPPGIPGELCIGGLCVARGYLNRPELTAEKFIPNLFKEGERLYKSGDLVRWLPDGNIEYLDRIDTQVKVRGFRIECGEIEAALSQHENIRDAVVIADKEEGRENALVAYIVFKDTANNLTLTELREILSKRLPDYMIPSYFVQLDKLPLTSNGKINRKALPKPDKALGGTREYVAPRNETEEKLVNIWSEILKVEKIGVYDNFFELGGHSLLATQVISRIRNTFNTEIPVKALFESPTIEGLVKKISQCSENIAPEILPVSREGNIPLSYAQERLWFLDQLEPDSAGYNMPGAIRLSGELKVEILEKSFTYIIERHENLRTVFPTEDGKPVQVIKDPEYFHIPIINLSNEKNKEIEAKKIADDEANKPFNLTNGPLLRAKLIKLDENEQILLFNMHHIISDGWSMGVLIRELGQIMNSLLKGENPELEPLAVQYADFGVWQRNWLEGGELDKQLSYWKEELSDAPAVINLPIDYTRPAIQTYNGSSVNFTIPENLTTGINNISRKHGSTIFMTLLSSFSILLHKLTGETDISIGSPIANRNRKEIEGLIGFFVNTLVLRNKIEDRQSFVELLKAVKHTTLEAYDHQDTPFEKLVEDISPDRNMSYSPLFQVMMTLQNTPNETIDLGDIKIAPFEIESEISKFDLLLNLSETGNTLEGSLAYNTSIFKPDTVSGMIKYYLKVLETIVENSEVNISDIDLLDEEEKHKLLVEWNDTKTDYPAGKCIQQLFEEQVAKTPDNIAVVYEDKRLTYRELNEKVNQLADILRTKGVKPDSIITLVTERSLEMIIGIMGAIKAGGAYLPVDPHLPEERIKFIVNDSGSELILTQEHLIDKLTAIVSRDQIVNLNDPNLYSGSPSNPELINTSSDLAYVIYTSGSTGVPKGVMIEHKSLNNLVNALKKIIYNNYNDYLKICLLANYSFDASVQQIFAALLEGHSLVLVPDEVRLNGNALVDFYNTNAINISDGTPVHINLILQSDFSKIDFTTLQHFVIGGEELILHAVEEIFKRVKNKELKITNIYGPTECTVDSTAYTINSDMRRLSARVPIGMPLPNIQCYILDKSNKLCPVGVAGELCISGTGLARGYLDRPDLTAEKFIANPFVTISPPLTKGAGGINNQEQLSDEHQILLNPPLPSHLTQPSPRAGEGNMEETDNRLYKTGDLARWNSDGNIEYLGRIDKQVKVRGFRIECGEIETVLAQNENIKDAVVIAHKEEGRENALVAYIVFTNPENILNSTELRDILSKKLPDYMIPSYFVQLDKLPLTSSGKLDRKSLPKPDKALGGGREYAAPENETEANLVKIWQEVMKVEGIGVNDNFFELGGDSILSIQIISRANANGMYLTAKDIFMNQTVRELARVAKTKRFIQAEQGIITGNIETGAIQKRFFERNHTDINHYNQSVLFKVSKDLDVEALEKVMNKLVRHHDMLRSSYTQEDGQWKQTIAENAPSVKIECFDFSCNSKEEQAAGIEEITQKLQQSMNITEGKLIAAAHFKLDDTDTDRLFIVIHHLVTDGVSWRIFMEDLMEGYSTLKSEGKISLPAKTTSFAYWMKRLTQYAQTEESLEEVSYWSALTEGKNESNISIDNHTGRSLISASQNLSFNLSERDTRIFLEEIPGVYHSQVNDLLLTGLLKALCKWTGKESGRWLIDMEGHGREELFEEVDLSRTMGWFTSVYPVLLEKSEGDGTGELIKKVKENLRAIPNHGTGYGILKYLSGDTELKNKLATMKGRICFNYLGQFQSVENESSSFIEGIATESVGSDIGDKTERDHDLTITGIVSGGELKITLSYSAEKFENKNIASFINAIRDSLAEIIEHCLTPQAGGYTPSDFPLIQITQEKLDEIQAAIENLLDIYPATKMQEFMITKYLSDEYRDEYLGAYHPQSITTIQEDNFSLSALQSTINIVAKNIPIFRTSFAYNDNSQLLQVLRKDNYIPVEFEDISSLSEEMQEKHISEYFIQDKARLFDVFDSYKSLMRVKVFQRSDKIFGLFISKMHVITDGWSNILFIKMLNDLYIRIKKGGTPNADILPGNSMKEFAALEQKILKDQVSKKFWKEFISRHNVKLLNKKYDTSDLKYKHGSGVHDLNPQLSSAIKKFVSEKQISLKSLFLTAYLKLLQDFIHEEKLIIGVMTSGRSDKMTNPLEGHGLFWTIAPFALDSLNIDEQTTHEVQELLNIIDAEYGRYPLTQIMEDTGYNELFFAVFNFLNFHHEKEFLEQKEEKLNEIKNSGKSDFHYPLKFQVSKDHFSEQFTLTTSHIKSYFSDEDIEKLFTQYEELLFDLIEMKQP